MTYDEALVKAIQGDGFEDLQKAVFGSKEKDKTDSQETCSKCNKGVCVCKSQDADEDEDEEE